MRYLKICNKYFPQAFLFPHKNKFSLLLTAQLRFPAVVPSMLQGSKQSARLSLVSQICQAQKKCLLWVDNRCY